MVDMDVKNWIVVVDDDAMSLTSARVLLSAEDMKVSCLPSGKSLLKFMSKNQPDLILLDVVMPEFDGFETLAALREQEQKENKPEIPIIFLTGEVDYEAERRGLKLGAVDYIHKPFNKDILVSRIRNHIHKSKIIVNLKENASRDKLTGFLNKGEGTQRIREAVGSLSGALLMLDLDSFKLVNDLYGHEKGDQMLIEFARLVKNSTREEDIRCRIGGDEFLLFCVGLCEESALSALTKDLNQQLTQGAKRILGDNHGIPLGISVGAVMVPEYGTDYDLLFNMADEAMYRTKKNGKHGYTVYEELKVSTDPVKSPEEELARLTKIIEGRSHGGDPLILGMDAFSAVFQFVERFNSSFARKALILLFILKAKKGPEDRVSSEAVASFVEVLKKSLGKSDVIVHTNNNHFLVLLPTMVQEPEANAVAERILAAWEELRESMDFDIVVASQMR